MAKEVADRLKPYVKDDETGVDPLASPIVYPDGDLGDNLRNLAGLLAQPLGIRVATVETEGNFDTHDAQADDLGKGLKQASEALAAFQADLEARGRGDRVRPLVWSVSAPRPAPHDSGGTDHGAGGFAFVMGSRAKSGILTDYPSLKTLDKDGNLAVTVDFRRIYCSLLEQWMGVDAGAVIPNAGGFGRLRVVA
jgi:uncharacterized protein (DUF1501 family)